MSSFSLLEHYEPPKNQGASKVHRYPLYLRPEQYPALPPPALTPLHREWPAPVPAPAWSDWQPVSGPQWDGFWRAAKTEDGAHS